MPWALVGAQDMVLKAGSCFQEFVFYWEERDLQVNK